MTTSTNRPSLPGDPGELASHNTRCTPTQKLAQLCDADQRNADRGLALLAGAVMAGEPMPEPYAEQAMLQRLLADARVWLETKPSPPSVHAAGQRLQRALVGVVADVSNAKGRAA